MGDCSPLYGRFSKPAASCGVCYSINSKERQQERVDRSVFCEKMAGFISSIVNGQITEWLDGQMEL